MTPCCVEADRKVASAPTVDILDAFGVAPRRAQWLINGTVYTVELEAGLVEGHHAYDSTTTRARPG